VKLAFVTSWLSSTGGGVSAAVQDLSRELNGCSASVSVLGLKDEAWDEDRSIWRGAPANAFPVIGPRAFGLSIGLRRTLAKLDPDAVHTHGIWMHGSAGVLAWAGGRKPYIVSPHGMLDRWAVANSPAKKLIARALYEDRHLQGAACIHALCMAEAKAIRAFGLTNPICVIPNGVSLPDPSPKPPPPWREDGRRVLLFLGRLHPKKNVHGLLSALAIVKANGGFGDWRLVIAGRGQCAYRAQLDALARELALETDVDFAGPMHGLRKHAAFCNASAFVLPSFSEGLPMAVLEAWSYGLPAALTSACNLQQGFEAGAAHEIGIEPESMANALAAFLSLDEEELIARGARGRKLAQSEFDWSRVAAEFMTVYGWMLGGGKVPPSIL
jgi:poly(glycerol-phosphate) alpha-glucosyltransferase